MTSYAKITDFASKDALLTGNPAKIVKGVEIDDEFNAIATADATSVKGPIGVTVDNTVVRWDGTTGRAVQGSGVTISDADVVTASGFTGPHNGTVGATTPSTGAFTILSATAPTGPSIITATATTGTNEAYFKTVNTGGAYYFGAENSAGSWFGASPYAMAFNTPAGKTIESLIAGAKITSVSSTGLAVTGIVTPEADNTRTLGTGALRWSTVYAGTGTINTSDAREKTEVASLTTAEINAAKQLSKEIGTYKFLTSVQSKGGAARTHVGMTVQRAIAIMEENGLDPFGYGFICHDVWEDKFVEHPAIDAADAVLDENGDVVTPAVEGKAAWTEQTQVAGDRYAFRYDQLTMFIAAGIEARLAALEAA